ncbi:MAG TPA: hypothetical protein VGG62_13100 [Terracidiphilus sp.]
MREKDDLDLLIDSALATYADPGPDSGLEDRVLVTLAAVRTATPRLPGGGRRGWLPWAVAIPIAAGLLFLWLSPRRDQPVPASKPQEAHVSARTAIAPHAEPSSEVRPGITHRHAVRATQPAAPVQTAQADPLPKLDVFPTPRPLTAEERALVVAVTQTPLPAQEALIEAESLEHQPVRIAEIQIPPLEPPVQGQP